MEINLFKIAAKAFKAPEPSRAYIGYMVQGKRKIYTADPLQWHIHYSTGGHDLVYHMNRVAPVWNAPIEVERDRKGRLRVVGPDLEVASSFGGSVAQYLGVGPHTHARGSGLEFVVNTWLLEQLRVTVDGLDLTMQPGFIKTLEGLVSVAQLYYDLSSVSITTNYWAWVVVCIDLTSMALTTVLGEEVLVTAPLLMEDIPSEVFTTKGLYPLVAIKLKYDTTSVPQSYITDLRYIMEAEHNILSTEIEAAVTISSGAINSSSSFLSVDTQSAASTDDLDTISAGYPGQLIVIRPANAARTVVIKDGTGNIYSAWGDITLDDVDRLVWAIYSTALAKWLIITAPSSTTTSAPSDAKYVTSTGHTDLSAEIIIPSIEFHSDALPTTLSGSDEFPGSSLDGAWSWVNQGSATLAVDKSHLQITMPSVSTGRICGIFRSYPGTSTWIAKISGWSSAPIWSGSNNYSFSLSRRDSSSGRIENYALSWSSSGTAMLLLCDRWTNATTYSSLVGSIQLNRMTHGTFYFKIEDNGTNLIFSWSLDGRMWTVLVSFARAAFLASADQIGLSIFTQQNGGTVYLESDFIRRIA